MKSISLRFLFAGICLCISLVLPLNSRVFAQTNSSGPGSSVNSVNSVNQAEMENLGPVEFINYEGPYSRIETRAQIRAIGYSLGVVVRTGQTRAGGTGRYFAIHSVSAPDAFKLDADILGFGVDVGVDHIKNLRLIVQGYLEGAYGYSEKDAALLAEYITVYNAVYRGDMNYLGSRYKKAVMDNITADKAGLSLRFDEWPGQTLLVIPLGMQSAGPINSVDSSPLTDSRVQEQLRQEPDRSIDSRKDMVDLKERQADEANQQADASREAIRQEEQRQAREREQARQQEQQARQEQQKVEEERKQPGADQAALDQRQEEAQKQEEDARQKQQDLDQKQEQLENEKAQADQTGQYGDQKAEEAQVERQGIAQDQQEVINQAPPPAPAVGILGAAIISPNASMGRVVKIDPATGKQTKQSVLNTINARTLTLPNGKIIAIAGENRGSGAIRLIEINSDTLEMAKQGDDDIAPNSLLWVNGANLYAITTSGGSLYLARFNTDLVLQARSSITVHPFASVTFGDGALITQRADGSAALLNPSDLMEKR
jgi:hypothetical protein